MQLTLHVKDVDFLPPDRELAQAAGRGVSDAVKAHLRTRNHSSRPADGMPRTGYYGDAANSVTTDVSGKSAVITIHKEGIALHYYGGVVYPTGGRKALAIPKAPATAGRRPAELDAGRQRLALVWPKGATAGTLRDMATEQGRRSWHGSIVASYVTTNTAGVLTNVRVYDDGYVHREEGRRRVAIADPEAAARAAAEREARLRDLEARTLPPDVAAILAARRAAATTNEVTVTITP